MYGRKRNGITSNSHLQYSEDEHDELLHTGSPIVMLIIHNLDHMMQPHEWETLLTREIHGARMLGVAVVRESSSSRPWGEGELTAYIFTRHDAPLIRQYLHNRRLGFRRLHVDTVTSENGIEAFLVHKILQLLKHNPQMSEVTMEQRINSFFRRIPSSIRPQDYDRTAVMHSIHQCMGLPASPPASSEESEADSDSPPLHRKPMAQPMQQKLPIQMPIEQSNTYFTPQIIRIDEYTMQLHFTPLYFELLDSMPIPPPTDERDQWIANANF